MDFFSLGTQTYRAVMAPGPGVAQVAQVAGPKFGNKKSKNSFGEHGQTVRGINLNPIAYDQGRYLTSRRPQK